MALSRRAFIALGSASALSACGGGTPDLRGIPNVSDADRILNSEPEWGEPDVDAPQPDVMTDVNPHFIGIRNLPYYGTESAGTMMIHEDAFKLYFVEGNGTVTEYPIATARVGVNEDYSNLQVGRLRENPSWTPTDTMVGAQPTSPNDPSNPLGEYAINLNRNGIDTLLRIHGTNTQGRQTIGTQASSGCIRILNEHVENLFYKVQAFKNAGVTMSVRHYDGVSLVPGVGYNFRSHQPQAKVTQEQQLPGIFRRIF